MTQALVKKGLVGKAVLEEPPKPQTPSSSPLKTNMTIDKGPLSGMVPFNILFLLLLCSLKIFKCHYMARVVMHLHISYANGYFV